MGDLCKSVETGCQSSLQPVYLLSTAENRFKAGVAFWQANAKALQRAQEQTGVPPHIIVGVLGVETMYGQQMGTYRVMDALCTLAFDFPTAHPKAVARSAYFLSELEAYLAGLMPAGAEQASEIQTATKVLYTPQPRAGRASRGWPQCAARYCARPRRWLWPNDRAPASPVGHAVLKKPVSCSRSGSRTRGRWVSGWPPPGGDRRPRCRPVARGA